MRNSLRVRWTILAVSLLSIAPSRADWFEHVDQAMGTEVSVQLWAENAQQAGPAIEAVMAEMQRIDSQFSPYKPSSQLSKLNRNAYDNTVIVSTELGFLISSSLEVSTLTGGAFDISFSSVGKLYDYKKHKKPTPEQITQRKSAINYRHIIFDKEAGTVRFSSAELSIDLGGIAKGYAVDRCISILRQHGVSHARVSAGGDSRMIGDKRGRPWMTGVRNPRSEGSSLMLPLENIAVSTSGDYERFFIDQETGERHHHIISPSTGVSAGGVQSVTIIAQEAITSDALSTSVFVLGTDRGLELINELPGVDAIIIDAQGLLHYSNDLERASYSSDS